MRWSHTSLELLTAWPRPDRTRHSAPSPLSVTIPHRDGPGLPRQTRTAHGVSGLPKEIPWPVFLGEIFYILKRAHSRPAKPQGPGILELAKMPIRTAGCYHGVCARRGIAQCSGKLVDPTDLRLDGDFPHAAGSTRSHGADSPRGSPSHERTRAEPGTWHPSQHTPRSFTSLPHFRAVMCHDNQGVVPTNRSRPNVATDD